MNHVAAIWGMQRRVIVPCECVWVDRNSVFDIAKAAIRRMPITISYEIVWAMLRTAPRRAYLLFEAQPAISVGYTFSLEITRNRRALNGRMCQVNGEG